MSYLSPEDAKKQLAHTWYPRAGILDAQWPDNFTIDTPTQGYDEANCRPATVLEITQQTDEQHKGTIRLQYGNARIDRMSKRRAKIAMAKRPTTVLTGAYPTSVGEISEPDANGMITLTATFEVDKMDTVKAVG